MLRYNDKVKCFNYNKHITSSQTELQYWAIRWIRCRQRGDDDCHCNGFWFTQSHCRTASKLLLPLWCDDEFQEQC